MDEIDKALLLIEFKSTQKECCLCSNTADDLYIVEFAISTGEKYAFTWPICKACMAVMGDQFAEDLPMFCTECSAAGWTQRSGDMPITAHAGFTEGCHNCLGHSRKGWWL